VSDRSGDFLFLFELQFCAYDVHFLILTLMRALQFMPK